MRGPGRDMWVSSGYPEVQRTQETEKARVATRDV